MKFIYDHDLHIHTQYSGCSDNPEQNAERILQYARDNKLHTVCLADHFWDEKIDVERPPCYYIHSFTNLCQSLPLPKADDVKMLFGCETELDKTLTLGITKERQDFFDFIVIPTTHCHFTGFTMTEEDRNAAPQRKAQLWVERLSAVLDMDLPFHKIGIAHLLCGFLAGRNASHESYVETVKNLPKLEMERLFKKAAKLGVGIELNQGDVNLFTGEKDDIFILPFQIAKECGCKFYFGSDAHNPVDFETAPPRFEKAIDMLGLEEKDKFILRDK